MAIYNCAPTLEEAIDSLYAQTYKNFKLILCDDGSTDNTYQIAKEYELKHDNIILLRNQKNIKLAASLNRCLKYVDTEYVARMDGDDISLPKRFEKQIAFLDQHPEYAIVSNPMIHFDEFGDWGLGKAEPMPSKQSFKNGPPHPHAPCMIRSAVIKEVNGYTVHKYLNRGQDYYLWYKIYKAGYKGYNLQIPLYKMRDGIEAMDRRTLKSRYYAFRIKLKVLSDLNVRNPYPYAILSLLKGFVPSVIMNKLRKKRMKVK